MKQRTMDEMITYFNREVSKMDIKHEDKIKLLGMITAIGYENKKQKRKWIPCSERLPEVGARVLVSCYGRVCYGKLIYAKGNSGYPLFEICDSTSANKPIVLETTAHNEYTKSRISAWMPLPEPYKGDTE